MLFCLDILRTMYRVGWILNSYLRHSFLQYLTHIALPLKFSELQETDKSKSVQEGSPIVLRCELSHDPSAYVDWYKDGLKLQPKNNMEIQSDGLTRTILIHSAENVDGGTYECSTSDDTITFKVDVEGDLFPSLPSSYQTYHIRPWAECS